jgi:hypothetical protein
MIYCSRSKRHPRCKRRVGTLQQPEPWNRWPESLSRHNCTSALHVVLCYVDGALSTVRSHIKGVLSCLENSLHAELMSIRNRPHGLIRKRRRRRSLDVTILTSDFPLDTQLATLLGSKLKESRWNKEKRTHKLTRKRFSVSTRHWVVYGWKYVHVENMLPLTPSVRHPESTAGDNMCMLRLFDDESHLSGTMSCMCV